MYLSAKFAFQIFGAYQPALQQAGNKRTGSGERVKDMQVLITQRATKLFAKYGIYRMYDIIDYFDRSIYNTQPLHHHGESRAEELIVQFDDDFLFGFGIVNILCPLPDRIVELLQGFGILLILLFL
ncbi:MAG: hypothetical protein LBV32_01840, partial [Tannerellaceae bacterium]|nr:hypothetical protein [Tannerellaceae bacterium]